MNVVSPQVKAANLGENIDAEKSVMVTSRSELGGCRSPNSFRPMRSFGIPVESVLSAVLDGREQWFVKSRPEHCDQILIQALREEISRGGRVLLLLPQIGSWNHFSRINVALSEFSKRISRVPPERLDARELSRAYNTLEEKVVAVDPDSLHFALTPSSSQQVVNFETFTMCACLVTSKKGELGAVPSLLGKLMTHNKALLVTNAMLNKFGVSSQKMIAVPFVQGAPREIGLVTQPQPKFSSLIDRLKVLGLEAKERLCQIIPNGDLIALIHSYSQKKTKNGVEFQFPSKQEFSKIKEEIYNQLSIPRSDVDDTNRRQWELANQALLEYQHLRDLHFIAKEYGAQLCLSLMNAAMNSRVQEAEVYSRLYTQQSHLSDLRASLIVEAKDLGHPKEVALMELLLNDAKICQGQRVIVVTDYAAHAEWLTKFIQRRSNGDISATWLARRRLGDSGFSRSIYQSQSFSIDERIQRGRIKDFENDKFKVLVITASELASSDLPKADAVVLWSERSQQDHPQLLRLFGQAMGDLNIEHHSQQAGSLFYFD